MPWEGAGHKNANVTDANAKAEHLAKRLGAKLRQKIREKLNRNHQAVEAATLVCLDLASQLPQFGRREIETELERRRRLNRRYPRPTPLQIRAGCRRAIAEGAIRRDGPHFFKSRFIESQNAIS